MARPPRLELGTPGYKETDVARSFRLSRLPLDLHDNAELAKPTQQSCGHALLVAVALYEILTTQVVEFHAVAEHVINGGEHRGGYGEDRLLGPPAALEPQKLGVEVAVFFARRGPGGLDERCFEPWGPLPRAGGAPFAGAFIQARAQARPRDEVARGGKRGHGVAHFREDHGGGRLTETGHRGEEV